MWGAARKLQQIQFPQHPCCVWSVFCSAHPSNSISWHPTPLLTMPPVELTYGPCFEESSGRTVQSACLSFNHGGQVVLQFRRRAPEDGGTCQSSSCHDVHVRLEEPPLASSHPCRRLRLPGGGTTPLVPASLARPCGIPSRSIPPPRRPPRFGSPLAMASARSISILGSTGYGTGILR